MFNYDPASSRSSTSHVVDDDGELDEGRNRTSALAMHDYDKLEFAMSRRSIFETQSDKAVACDGNFFGNNIMPSKDIDSTSTNLYASNDEHRNIDYNTITINYTPPALPLFCPHCSAEFSGKARNKNLVMHLASAHSCHISTFVCPNCQYCNPTASGIALHFRQCASNKRRLSPPSSKNSTYQTNTMTVNSTPTISQATQRTTRDNNVLYPQDSGSTISCPICNQQFIGKSYFKSLEQHRNKEHPLTSIIYTCSKCLQFSSPNSISIRAHAARCKKPLSARTLSANSVIMNDAINHTITDSNTCLASMTEHTTIPNEITNDPRPLAIVNNSTPQIQSDTEQNTANIDYFQDNPEVPPAACSLPTDIPISFDSDLRYKSTDMDSNQTCSNISIAIISEYLNNLHSDSRLHPRLRNLTGVLLSEVSRTDYSYEILIDRFVSLYTTYLTRIDEQRRTTDLKRLESLSLKPVQLRPSADLILRSISHAVYKNPTRHSDVRHNLISELKSDVNYWHSQATLSEEHALTYDQLVRQVESSCPYSPIFCLQIAANAFQRIFRIITESAETDLVIYPRNMQNDACAIHYMCTDMANRILPCIPTKAITNKQHKDIRKRRNRALYFCNTPKLAKELLGNRGNYTCLSNLAVVEDHFKSIFNTNKRITTLDSNQPNGSCSTSDYELHLIQPSELLAALRKMPKSSAAGPDRVSIQQLVRFDPNCQIISLLANMIISAGYMPRTWRCNRSLLVPKAGKIESSDDLNDALKDISNFRPITISSVLCRLFHRVILKKLREHLDIPPCQFAFSDYATLLCIKAVKLLRSYSSNTKQRMCFAFLDIRAAFDTLNHEYISATLEKTN
ncbi:hypothetical protein GJ496_010041, partial [Pomphorhynchus laevis]